MVQVQPLFAATLDFTLQFLERSFQQDPRFATNKNTTKDDDDEAFFSSSGRKSQQQQQQTGGGADADNEAAAAKLLESAYAFMELTPPADGSKISQEQVKKQYKKLSLRYHPDRNGGSPESQKLMQKLNACLDIIEKDITGVTRTTEDEHDNDKEDPYERFQRMRKEMREEMERELKRYQEMKDQFEKNKQKHKEECMEQVQRMELDTEEGRQQANEKFMKQVQQQQQQQQTKKKKKASNNNNTKHDDNDKSTKLDDIDGDEEDDDDNPKQQNEEDDDDAAAAAAKKKNKKPRNEVMECNYSNDVIIALCMNLPDIAIPLLQQQIQDFFQETTRNMHFDGIKKTPQQVRLEFLQQPLDDDDNSLMHYAVYYESYHVTKAICQVALKDVHSLSAILSQTNIYGHTPLFFAELAVDDLSILPLIQSQLQLAELIQQKTQFVPALRAATTRLINLCHHIGLATTVSTILSVYITFAVFDIQHPIGSALCLLFVQTFGGTDGINSTIALLTFGCMWKIATIVIQIILQYVMVEILVILAPITIAGLVSSGRKRRGGGGRLVDLFLMPLRVHAFVAKHVQPLLLAAVNNGYIAPKVLITKGWVRPYLLSWIILLSLAVKQVLHY